MATIRIEIDYRLFKGVSIQLNSANSTTVHKDATNIASMPGIRNMWPVVAYSMKDPTDHARSFQNFQNFTADTGIVFSANVSGRGDDNVPKYVQNSHVMAQVDKLHAQGLTGKGIKIGQIDSGVSYHP
jgi:hypothetical protein